MTVLLNMLMQQPNSPIAISSIGQNQTGEHVQLALAVISDPPTVDTFHSPGDSTPQAVW